MSMARWMKARWVMGSALIKRLATLPFVPPRGGRPWLAELAKEGLASVPEEMWTYAAGSSRCIGCGLCDSVARSGESPSSWIMGEAREPSTAPLALAHATRLEELATDVARVCPAGVPAQDVARLIRDNARKLAELEG